MKKISEQWRDSRNSLNRFIVNYTNIPLRISRRNTLIVKKKLLGFNIWVNYKAPIDIPVHYGIDSIIGMISLKTDYIRKGDSINFKKFVKDDIEENSSKFFGSLIGYLEKNRLI